MKSALAIRVGMTALPMTAATRCEYWPGVMMPWLRPKSAEMVIALAQSLDPVALLSLTFAPYGARAVQAFVVL